MDGPDHGTTAEDGSPSVDGGARENGGEYEQGGATQNQKKARRRAVNACATCRARKVKCDERPNGCLNCERLQLACLQNGTVTPSSSATTNHQSPTSPTSIQPVIGIKRKRTFRSCVPCRDSKVKCSGERPLCSRCQQRRTTCVYDAEQNEPAWVQSIGAKSGHDDVVVIAQSQPQSNEPRIPQGMVARGFREPGEIPGCPPGLSWLFSPQLPPKAKLHALLDAYFNNVHPIRVFAFEHKPSFIRMLDEGQLIDASDQALLHIMCALGARFYALEYSDSFAPLPKELIQTAGSQWAKIAEEMFFTDYSTISITKLKVLILLHDQEARTGNYAGSFLLTGLVIRMAHALQLNNEVSADILCKEVGGSPNEVSVRESRRRLMWACYMIDVWAGSGVDHLTILNERDLKIQLPCNERQFSLQIPCVTERLEKGEALEMLPAADVPEKPSDNLGMAAYYVRIVSIWRRVLRFVKHMDEEQPPWEPNSGFATLIEDIQSWKRSLPSWLDFSADNIYIRRESHQLGALLLIHCMYHHVMCDVHRIALPDLFKNQDPFIFPATQRPFVAHLQDMCFEHAQRMSVLVSTILAHGVKHFADSILPSFVYNSSRIMLYYIARLLDVTKPGVSTLIARTVELVQQNNKALREMTRLYPLAESLCTTTERWLETVRASLARGTPTTYIAPQDPSENEVQRVVGAPDASISQIRGANRNWGATGDTALASLPTIAQSLATQGQSPMSARLTPLAYQTSPPADHMGGAPGLAALAAASSHGANGMNGAVMAQPDGTVVAAHDQPAFDLDLESLQNFFEWEASGGENASVTGFEGFGPLGWTGSFSIM